MILEVSLLTLPAKHYCLLILGCPIIRNLASESMKAESLAEEYELFRSFTIEVEKRIMTAIRFKDY